MLRNELDEPTRYDPPVRGREGMEYYEPSSRFDERSYGDDPGSGYSEPRDSSSVSRKLMSRGKPNSRLYSRLDREREELGLGRQEAPNSMGPDSEERLYSR